MYKREKSSENIFATIIQDIIVYIATFLVIFFLTSNLLLAFLIIILEIFIELLVYYFYEKFGYKIEKLKQNIKFKISKKSDKKKLTEIKGEEKQKELLYMSTAGSVDDGKSTLIGRLLHDCQSIYEDQFLAIEKTCKKVGKDVDLALLLDGLKAEREQGITIDVAYRYFISPKRKFIIADVPGHTQYTRNMVTGASGTDLVLILVDARKGLLEQTKRHLSIASLLAIPHILIVVNKMDLVNYSEKVYQKIEDDVINFSSKLSIPDIQFIPASALKGDMVVDRGSNMNWYSGRTLLDSLENLKISGDRNLIDFRLPVQMVVRPDKDFRGYAGRIGSGIIRKGQHIKVLPSGKASHIKDVFVDRKSVDFAFCPQSVLITLEDEIDISRGDMIVRYKNLPDVDNNIEATICWMDDNSLELNKDYIIKHTTKTTRCKINDIRYSLNIDNLHRKQAQELKLNEIGRVYIRVSESILFDTYHNNKNTGNFILIDEITRNTVAAGIIIRKGTKDKIDSEEKVEIDKKSVESV